MTPEAFDRNRVLLEGLQKGDRVLIDTGRAGVCLHVSHVRALHKNYIEDLNGNRYSRITGSAAGKYAHGRLWVPTPELEAVYRRQRIIHRLKDAKWEELPVEVLDKVVTVLNEWLAAEKAKQEGGTA